MRQHTLILSTRLHEDIAIVLDTPCSALAESCTSLTLTPLGEWTGHLGVDTISQKSKRQYIKRGLPQLREMVLILYASALGGLLAGALVAQIAPVAHGFAALAQHAHVTGLVAMVSLVLLTAVMFVSLVASRLQANATGFT